MLKSELVGTEGAGMCSTDRRYAVKHRALGAAGRCEPDMPMRCMPVLHNASEL